MVASMACFAVEDALIKQLGGRLPAAQIIWVIGLGGALVLAFQMRRAGEALWIPAMNARGIWVRTGFEVFGTLFFVSALVTIPLSTASAVIQATPLVVAMGAALFLGAQVGWRRWVAISIGFGGVLLILRPGSDSFDPGTLLAIAGMCGLAGRDLATRRLPKTLSSARLSAVAFAALVPGGLILQMLQGLPIIVPDGRDAMILLLCIVIGLAGYLAIVGATRQGDLAVVSSFRYSRMVFALGLAVIFFKERPDFMTLLGIGVIIAAGLYTIVREARLARGG
jgi:drug/metabolite transporter (DMT)-like permease